jgi:hypothetical protein
MGTKIRKEIYIEPEQDALLKLMVQDTGLPESTIIQQALDRQAQAMGLSKPDTTAWEREEAFIREFVKRQPSASTRAWKREDLYDREILRRY